MPALIAVTVLASAAPVWADRPGTPNQVRAEVLGPDRIRVSWFDTANRHGDAPRVVFELEPGSSADPSSGRLTLSTYDGDQRSHWDLSNLQLGIYHCFRVWSRNTNDDLRSDLPSAFACANLPSEMPPVTGRMVPNLPQAIGDHRTVWLQLRADRLTPETDGFVVAIATGSYCPVGWREVVFQNGGFAGLGGAKARRATDRYWLCWSDHVHGLAPPAAPPVR